MPALCLPSRGLHLHFLGRNSLPRLQQSWRKGPAGTPGHWSCFLSQKRKWPCWLSLAIESGKSVALKYFVKHRAQIGYIKLFQESLGGEVGKDGEWVRTELLRARERPPCRMDSMQTHWRMWRARDTLLNVTTHSLTWFGRLSYKQRDAVSQLADSALL